MSKKPKNRPPYKIVTKSLRIDEASLLEILEKAAAEKVTWSKYMRAAGLNRPVRRHGRRPSIDSPLLRQLSAIGNNLNQLVKLLHQLKHQSLPADLEATNTQVAEVQQILQKVAKSVLERSS